MFCGSASNKSAAKITTDDIRGYIAYLDGEPAILPKRQSADAHQHAARLLRLAARSKRRSRKNPMAKIKSLKAGQEGCPPGADRRGAGAPARRLQRRTARKRSMEFLGVDRLPSERGRAAACRRSAISVGPRRCKVTGKGDKDRVVYFQRPCAADGPRVHSWQRKGGDGLFAVTANRPTTPLKPRAIQRHRSAAVSERAGLEDSASTRICCATPLRPTR